MWTAALSAHYAQFMWFHDPPKRESGKRRKSDLYQRRRTCCLLRNELTGGDIERVLNQRCIIGAFPWKFEGGEACPCRIMAFFGVGDLAVEELAASF